MKRLPSLKQLEYLVALDDTRHFARAADRCHITPSTLSAGIRDLETVLGSAIAERSKRQVLMTPLGEDIAARARLLLRDADDIMALAASDRAPLSGDLRLGAIPTISPFLLPRVLPGLYRQYPQLRLFLKEEKTDELLSLLREGEIDLALIARPYAIDRLEFRALFDDPFYFACRRDHPLADEPSVSVKRFASEPLMLLEEGHCLRGHALDAGRSARGSQMRAQYEASSLHTLVQMVAGGIGVTLLPKLAVDAGIGGGANIVPLPLTPAAKRQVGFVWRRASLRGAEFELFADAIAEQVIGKKLA